jgi:undecaprenol kinase
LKFHYLAAIAAIILSCVFNISSVEWALVMLSIGLVIVSELFNTAIERMVDLSESGFTPAAGVIKDVSAGAVFVASLISLLVGGLVFIPKCI